MVRVRKHHDSSFFPDTPTSGERQQRLGLQDYSVEIPVGTNGNASCGSTFPRKLAEMLGHEPEVLVWSEHGLSFHIRDSEELTNRLLPMYFRHSKLTSFQRQLNLYGFRRITKGTDIGAYFHPQFRRDRPELVSQIKRLPGQGATATARFLPLYFKDVENCADSNAASTTYAVDAASIANQRNHPHYSKKQKCNPPSGSISPISTPGSMCTDSATDSDQDDSGAPPQTPSLLLRLDPWNSADSGSHGSFSSHTTSASHSHCSDMDYESQCSFQGPSPTPQEPLPVQTAHSYIPSYQPTLQEETLYTSSQTPQQAPYAEATKPQMPSSTYYAVPAPLQNQWHHYPDSQSQLTYQPPPAQQISLLPPPPQITTKQLMYSSSLPLSQHSQIERPMHSPATQQVSNLTAPANPPVPIKRCTSMTSDLWPSDLGDDILDDLEVDMEAIFSSRTGEEFAGISSVDCPPLPLLPQRSCSFPRPPSTVAA